jgi:hypothetical protein
MYAFCSQLKNFSRIIIIINIKFFILLLYISAKDFISAFLTTRPTNFLRGCEIWGITKSIKAVTFKMTNISS